MNRRNFLIASTLATPLRLLGEDQTRFLRDLAKEAYIWGVPLVLQAMYPQRARDRKFPMNRLHRVHAVSQSR
jgi:hypothetical protein